MVNHPIELQAQRSNMGCWEAAAAMIIGGGPMCIDPGAAAADPWVGMEANDINIKAFADHHGFVFHPPRMTHSLEGIQKILSRGPAWTAGAVPSGHVYVIGGYSGKQLHIFDPWPPNVGSVYWVSYSELINKHPFGMVWMLTAR